MADPEVGHFQEFLAFIEHVSADNLHNPSPIKNNKNTEIVRLSYPNFENASNCMS